MKGNHKHGHGAKGRETPTYQTWMAMLSRCTNPKQANYPYYGGRGITVCERWRTFSDFLADMGESFGKTIERINKDGNYEPGNCRWASRAEQTRNTSRTRFLTHNGETLCLTDWAARAGIPASTLATRLRRGWTIERALS